MSNQQSSQGQPQRKGLDFIGVSVVYICHDGKGNFLMQKRGRGARDEHGAWDCGAGGVEFGDTIEDTLRKEIKEEYGADILDSQFIGFRDIHRQHNGEPTHWVSFDYKVLVDPAQVKNGEPHKFDEIGWFKLSAMPAPMHSQWEKFFEKYQDKLQ